MKTRRYLAVLGVICAVWAQVALAVGTKPNAGNPRRCLGTYGGEIPCPFNVMNQVAELADGERYVLVGTIVIDRGQPYLAIDLKAHPWLASERRRADPFYPISSQGIIWSNYEAAYVRLTAVADGRIEGAHSVIWLQTTEKPSFMQKKR